MTPCKLELDVLPLDSVDMYGEPDKTAAYSLSGHVEVKLTPPTSILYDPPASEERFMLESLILTFEGQSELLTPETGYGACRLVEFSQELIRDGPVEIGHFWDENLRDPQRWLITFNLAIPGWLPPTSYTSFGNGLREEPEVSYRLSAKATFRDMRPGSSKSLRTLCYGYSKLPSTQTATSPTAPVKINRYAIPPPSPTMDIPDFPQFPFPSVEYAGSVKGISSQIPADVLAKLRVVAYVPQHIPVDCENFPLFLRVRPEGLSAEERRRLRLPKFSFGVTQTDVLRSSMSSKYAAKWPVPAPSEQPPKRPLRVRRRDAREYECGLLLSSPPNTTAKCTHSILPRGFPDHFDLHGEGDGFADAAFDDPNTWVQMRLNVPFRTVFIDEKHLEEHDEIPVPKLRPTESGPLLTVSHTLDFTLTCTYELPEGEGENMKSATDELHLTLPLSFVRLPRGTSRRTLPDAPVTPCASEASAPLSPAEVSPAETRQATHLPASMPYAQALPAYHQLFHSNGVLREDPTPLPRYTRHPEDAEDLPPAPAVCKQTTPTKLPLSSIASTTPEVNSSV
ncbi:hypothetical protein C8Q77DRAFT_1050596 [Trametes polyzona]|nr:hypothetical protein C8Q77DRAFT_1050596 [Trametes polyzona]